MIALVAVLLLQPVLAEDGPVRVVASGVGGDEVVWTLDGAEVGRTADREALVLDVEAGAHDLRAASAARGTWHALARPDGTADGAAFVPGWSATHEATPRPSSGDGPGIPPLPLTLGLAAAVLLAWPRRLAGLPRRRSSARRPSGRRAQGP